jgi:hypothetical protein
LDRASRVRGCLTPADDIAGDAAANVVLALKTSRDVPERIEIPAYVYRGTVPVGPGAVELGRRFNRTAPVPTEEQLAMAGDALGGRIVGIIVPAEPDAREPEAQRLIREEIEAAVIEAGATPQVCVGRKAAARTCIDDLVAFGAPAIVTIATGTDLSVPVTAAVDAGVMVLGVNEKNLGDAGAVYVRVNPYAVGRLEGRMAGAHADRVWRGQPVEAVVFNDAGAGGQDRLASAVERALVQTGENISVVARLASSGQAKAAAAVRTMLKRYPGVRMIVGRNAAAAAPILIKRRNVNPDLVIYAQDCTPDVIAAIDAGKDTGGRIKGCVDRNAAGAGRLAGDVLIRLAAGETIPEIVEVPVLAYEP